jgi:hypothetical protein
MKGSGGDVYVVEKEKMVLENGLA